MKFRAVISDSACLKQFVYVVNAVAKLTKVCTVRITASSIYFIVIESTSLNSTPGLWCELKQHEFFSEFKMEGVNKEYDQIYFEVRTDTLARALSVLRGMHSSALRLWLAQRQSACLSMLIRQEGGRLVTHHVPITLLPRRLWTALEEPRVPAFHASLQLPPLRVLRSVSDRMRRLSSRIAVSADSTGRLQLRVTSHVVSASTFFQCRSLVPAVGELSHPEEASVTVDVKPLATFLSGAELQSYKAICNVIHERMLHMLLVHDGVTLQYFIPGIVQH